jgi:hypothetical protein
MQAGLEVDEITKTETMDLASLEPFRDETFEAFASLDSALV